jgi:hypothetical protein
MTLLRSKKSAAKVAITLRLEPENASRLQALAQEENRTLTNYVETVLLRDLSRRDEAARVITMLAAPGTSSHIEPHDIVRGEGEPDDAYAARRALLVELWSIPDDG